MHLKEITLMYCGCLHGVDSDDEVTFTTDFNDVKKCEFGLHKTKEPLNEAIVAKYVTPSWWGKLFLHGS